VHIIYRAQGEDGISRLGYASSSDGFHIEERWDVPIFSPIGSAEALGCEDPRIIRIGDFYYMSYTAYGKRSWGKTVKERLAQVAITSISVKDFLEQRWNWRKRIYPFPEVDSKNCVLFPEKFQGKYVMYHRIPPHIWMAYSDTLEDWSASYHRIVMTPSQEWEKVKIGAAAPPVETEKGWLFIYHGVDEKFTYRLGLALVDRKDPAKISKLQKPILEPTEEYEGRIIFSCGMVVLDGKLLVYYGANDSVIGVAEAELSKLLELFEEVGR
jgi:predicted GH43/DUF377 family glycosyl hydrolase